MELIYKIPNLSNINNKANSYLVGNKSFALRLSFSITNSQLKTLVNKSHNKNKKIYVLVNKIFFDNDLANLKEYLIYLKSINVDGIFFADLAIVTLAKELNMSEKLFFYHETFLRNKYDIETYQESGIPNIVISKDANIKDIKQLDKNKKGFYGINVFGYFPMYYSKRKVLKVFNKVTKQKTSNNDLVIKEATREDMYPLLITKDTTTIFSPLPLSYAKYLLELKEYCSFFIIDSLFINKSIIEEVVSLFSDSLQNDTLIDENVNKPIKTTDGFINSDVEEAI